MAGGLTSLLTRRRAVASLVALGGGCARTGARGRANQGLAGQTVLAVQAFLDPHSEARVRALWRRLHDERIDAQPIRLGLRPHMTMGAWIVAAPPAFVPERLGERLGQAAMTLPALAVGLRLLERTDAERGFYLSPGADPGQRHDLLAFHARLHRLLGPVGAPQRSIDSPGTFWPHVSLTYHFVQADRERARSACAALSAGVPARLEQVGLVAFGPTRTLAVFPLAAA